MRVIIAGSRSIPVNACLDAIDSLFYREKIKPTEIVSGGAKGPDTAGEMWAKHNGVPVRRFIPDWDFHGKKAGILRNEEMAVYAKPDGILVAFWDGKSRGTENMIAVARKHGLKRYVRKPPETIYR